MSKSQKAHRPAKQADPAEHGGEHHEELVHVPKGESKLRFFLLMGLTIFVLIIFVVPSAFLGALGGTDQTDEVMMTWTSPGGEEKELRASEFYQSLRAFDRLRNWGAYFGMQGLERASMPERARYLLLEDIAKEWGIYVTDREVAQTVLAMFQGDLGLYDGWVSQQRGLSKATFEATVRRAIRIRRLQELVSAGFAVSDPAKVEEAWKAAHQEYAFDTITVPVEDYLEAARAEIPDDVALRAWFEGLTEFQRRRFQTPERWAVEVAWAPVAEGESYPALVEAYPPGDDVDAETRARNYWNSVSYVRFRRPQPEEGAAAEEGGDEAGSDGGDDAWPTPNQGDGAAEGEAPPAGAQDEGADTGQDAGVEAGEPPADEAADGADSGEGGAEEASADDAPPARNPLYFEFDEVREDCLREAPIHAAFQNWMADLRQRVQNGEEIDLAAECARLGLVHQTVDTPKTREEWMADEEHPWAGPQFVALTQRVPAGQLVQSLVLSEAGFAVVRVTERRPPEVPPFEDVRDEVAEAWAQGRAAELAVAALEKVRDLLAERPSDPEAEFVPNVSAEVFREAASSLGFEVTRRDYRERNAPLPDPPDIDPVTDAYLRGSTHLYLLSPGDVPAAEANRQGTHAFLVRLEGVRDADLSKANPADLENLAVQQATTASQEAWDATFGSLDYLRERYGLWVQGIDEVEGEEAPAEG